MVWPSFISASIFEEGDKFDGRVGVNQLRGTFKADPSSGTVSMEYSLTQVASLEPNVMEFEERGEQPANAIKTNLIGNW